MKNQVQNNLTNIFNCSTRLLKIIFVAINWTGKFIVTGKVCKQNFEKVRDFLFILSKTLYFFYFINMYLTQSSKKKVA